jgi:hypothetical protein
VGTGSGYELGVATFISVTCCLAQLSHMRLANQNALDAVLSNPGVTTPGRVGVRHEVIDRDLTIDQSEARDITHMHVPNLGFKYLYLSHIDRFPPPDTALGPS